MDLEEALVTPGVVPAVLDQPIWHLGIGICAIAHCQDRVVHIARAALADLRSVDTMMVIPEVTGHLKSNTDRTMRREVILQALLVAHGEVHRTSRHIHTDAGRSGLEVARRRAAALGDVESTGTVLGTIRVVELRVQAPGGPNVLEGVRGETAIAAVVVEGLRTVDKLLLREARRVPGVVLDGHVRLEAACGRKRPATAAMALVLHLRDHAALAPVDSGGQVHAFHGARELRSGQGGTVCRRAILRGHEHLARELLVAHVRKMVQPSVEAPARLHVVGPDALEGRAEVGQTKCLVLGARVHPTVAELELPKLLQRLCLADGQRHVHSGSAEGQAEAAEQCEGSHGKCAKAKRQDA
mmetsp:Transcript_85490/g.217973  ORF Transcript_85490/g.217973 Transcript_85490/m.217973 type:complete len:355 (+) Transcript_85490:216-1280(+)